MMSCGLRYICEFINSRDIRFTPSATKNGFQKLCQRDWFYFWLAPRYEMRCEFSKLCRSFFSPESDKASGGDVWLHPHSSALDPVWSNLPQYSLKSVFPGCSYSTGDMKEATPNESKLVLSQSCNLITEYPMTGELITIVTYTKAL